MNARQARLFHRTFAATHSLSAALRAAGCAPRCRARKRSAACRDTAIRAPCRRKPEPEADLERAVAALESEAVRRALSGVAVPVFHQGRECGSTVKHSDQLLMFLLKTLKPGRYAGGKESAPTAPTPPEKTFALEIDFAHAEETHGGEKAEEEAKQEEAEGAGEDD